MDGAPPLVGRRAELRSLTEVLSRSSQTRAVVLVGEAGVGKTRLVDEVVRRAEAAAVTVVKGGCLPLTDSVPFLPVTEALRGLNPAGGPPSALEQCTSSVRAELSLLMPEWSTDPAPGGREWADGWQRGRLFAALRDLLAADRACAMVIEDLHWADPTTLDFDY